MIFAFLHKKYIYNYIQQDIQIIMNVSHKGMMAKIFSHLQGRFPSKGKKEIEQWDFIMTFEQRYHDQIERYFERYMPQDDSSNKFNIVEHQKEQQILVLLHIGNREVEQQATDLKILKKKQKESYKFTLREVNKQIYIAEEQKNIALCNYLKWIRARMLPSNKLIYEQEMYEPYNKEDCSSYPVDSKGDKFTPDQQLRAKYNYLITHSIKREGVSIHQKAYVYPFVDIMKHAGFVQLTPVHKRSYYSSVISENVGPYVGANSQTYFDFLAFLQRWLVLPAVIGLLTFIFNVFFEYTADDSPGDFLYAFVVMIWSVVFITKWEHAQKWTQACNSVGYSEEWSYYQDIVDSEGCRYRQSRVSGQKQPYTPFIQGLYRYSVSMFVLVSILLGTLFFMVLSLNARGFVDEDHKIIYFEDISAWAREGGIFDANTSWAQIPNLVHVLVTNIFDEQIYRPLVKKFTKFQQHFHYKTYENNIIVKFFVYEFIITFADLFYIAFVRMDIVGLREQLLSLFFIDIIRRLVAELIIPKISARIRSYFTKKAVLLERRQSGELAAQAILEVNKQTYQPFDDYLEIVTNFGYLVMISSCFPLAPVLIYLAHGIQVFQDKYKIIHIFKRKLPSKYVGMGYWNSIMVFLCYVSIITNILLFAFSSQQIVSYFPKLYEASKDILYGNTQIGDLVSSTASAVFDKVVQTTTQTTINFQQLFAPKQESPFEFQCPDMPMMQSFMAPTIEHEVQFISIIFVIEHIFLIIFLCLRHFLSKQECLADVLVERRNTRRALTKYLDKAVISDIVRDSIRDNLVHRVLGAGAEDQTGGAGLLGSLIQLGQKPGEEETQKGEAKRQTRSTVESDGLAGLLNLGGLSGGEKKQE